MIRAQSESRYAEPIGAGRVLTIAADACWIVEGVFLAGCRRDFAHGRLVVA